MITLKSGLVDDPFGLGSHPDAIPLLRIDPLELEEPEHFKVSVLGEHDGCEDVEISATIDLPLWERPGVGSWKPWLWRPWMRFRRHVWGFEAIVTDDGAGNQTFSVVGEITETVTFHRSDPRGSAP